MNLPSCSASICLPPWSHEIYSEAHRETVSSAAATRNAGLAAGALLASSATLICCVLPAALVAAGAGAALAGLVTAVPQLIWLSEHKALVFSVAAALLAISGISLWISRRAPCPSDPRVAQSCRRLRQVSVTIYAVALLSFALGITFAFVLPKLTG
jgi:hypothetical protein